MSMIWFGKKNIDVNLWGLERAVPDLLTESDKKWIELRYKIVSELLTPIETVLDATCGSGFGSKILAKNAKYVYGVDISKEAIKYAQQRYGAKNIKFKPMDVCNMSFKDNFFDIAVGIETIEHIVKYQTYLKELNRVTKNNGGIIMSTPQKKSHNPLTPFHVKEFEYHEFLYILQKNFTLDKVIGLVRQDDPFYEVSTEKNYKNFDIYLAICKNKKL